MFFISIHIPKTAGTALAKIFDDTSLRRIMYDYGTERDLTLARTCSPEVKANRDFITSYFRYLHGHFHYLKYADVFPDAPVLSTVRHPVDRVISQFQHIQRSGDKNNWRHKLIMEGEMNLIEFSKFDFIANAQWYYLEGREVKDYDFIFVQEKLDRSLQLFCDQFEVPEIREYLGWYKKVPSINSKPKGLKGIQNLWRRKPERITQEHRQAIEKNCERDMEIYRLSLERVA